MRSVERKRKIGEPVNKIRTKSVHIIEDIQRPLLGTAVRPDAILNEIEPGKLSLIIIPDGFFRPLSQELELLPVDFKVFIDDWLKVAVHSGRFFFDAFILRHQIGLDFL